MQCLCGFARLRRAVFKLKKASKTTNLLQIMQFTTIFFDAWRRMPKNRGFADLHFTTNFFETKCGIKLEDECEIGGEINEGILQIQSYAEVSESRKAEAMSKLAEMVDIF